MTKLNVAAVRAAKHPGDKNRPIRIGDGNGLNLQIAAGGAKSWLYRYTRRGKTREMGLGTCDPDGRKGVSLSEARRLAGDAKRQLVSGLDPITEREKAALERRQQEERGKERTFRVAAEGCIKAQRDGWKNEKHAAQWAATLEAYVYPTLGGKDVAEISIHDIVHVLRPIWTRIPETASRVRQRIERVLDYAAAPSRQWRSPENPARWRGVLEHELSPIAKVRKVRNQPSLPWQQMPAFITALEAHEGAAAKALKFCVLTACRSGEARHARWREIDLERGVWTIPVERMKARKLHRVPLSAAARHLLKDLMQQSTAKPSALVFPSPGSGVALSDMALSQLLRGMSYDGLETSKPPIWRDKDGRAAVVHGFRSTFKSWALSTSYPDHLSELALAHSDKDRVRAAYARDDMLEERRPMMEAWAHLCTSPASQIANITDMKRKRI